MLATTRGIVFHTLKYSDSSIITKIYTEEFGLQSFMVSAAHSKKSATKINLLQPLALVECVVYHKEKKQLQRIKEIKSAQPYQNISSDISKSGILFFLNEMLYKSIKEEESNPPLFNFIYSALLFLDLKTDSCANFHLLFLLKLSSFLGFRPQENHSTKNKFFDLQEGVFLSHEPVHPFFITANEGNRFLELCNCDFENSAALTIGGAERKLLLEKIIQYYTLHLSSLSEIKSHKVLEEVMM